jgi:DNA transposition AAA+ family ATPase
MTEIQKLSRNPQLIIIDEIDYLMNDTQTIETLRDIHDKTNCLIIFVGMGLAHKKLERYKHLYDRFSEIVKFEIFNVSDVKQIIDEISEVSFEAGAVEILHKKYNRFRQIIQAINQFETIAKKNNLTGITKETAEAIL